MPFANSKDARIYYESQGSGMPVTMIMGFGGSSGWWFSQTPALSEHFNVITLDNRGTGETETERDDISMDDMADDVAAVLDDAGVHKTHLVGISMGGMIAQNVVLRHSDRIEKLALCATLPGGIHSVSPTPEVAEVLTSVGQTDQPDILEAFNNIANILFPPEYLAEHAAELLTEIASNNVPPPSFMTLVNQLGAIMQHDTYDKLPTITQETLVMTGDADVLVPPQNSEIIAGQIPNARLKVFPGCGHGLNVQAKDEFNRELIDFLKDG